MTLIKPDTTTSLIGKWKSYPAYKDSGVEWLGKIPEHWEVKRLKFVAKIFGGGTPSKENLDFWSGDIPWVSPKDMKAEIIYDAEDHITEYAIEHSATRLIQPGAVLIVVRSGILRHSIPVSINVQPVALNQDMKALVVEPFLKAEYVASLIRGHQHALLMEWRKEGATVESIEFELLANTPCLVPVLSEQHAIATFLDRETAKINALIAKKERLVELLQEKRAALISQAVTKGLDPTVPVKDSGVEWLGEIPAHWGVKRLKFCLRSIEQGWSPLCENRPAEVEEWGVLKVGCVNGIKFNPTENKALPAETQPFPELEIKGGDVLVSRANTRELLGSASVVTQVRPRLLLCDKLYRLNLLPGAINSNYFVLAMGSSTIRFQLERDATGASNSMQNISQGTILNLIFPLPNVTEQQAIVTYLDHETAKIDALISRIREGIEKLKEYSTALISAAVTGKIDVRGEITPSDGTDL
jgi:type I restriction enzyme, S subunit